MPLRGHRPLKPWPQTASGGGGGEVVPWETVAGSRSLLSQDAGASVLSPCLTKRKGSIRPTSPAGWGLLLLGAAAGTTDHGLSHPAFFLTRFSRPSPLVLISPPRRGGRYRGPWPVCLERTNNMGVAAAFPRPRAGRVFVVNGRKVFLQGGNWIGPTPALEDCGGDGGWIRVKPNPNTTRHKPRPGSLAKEGGGI